MEVINALLKKEDLSFGEEYAHKLLIEKPKYLQRLKGESDVEFARKWTVICFGLFNKSLTFSIEGRHTDDEGKVWESELLEFYYEIICKILSKQFQNYENSCTKRFFIKTPSTNYWLGRMIAELVPGAEDPQFEKILSILSDSILPELLPIVPDIKRESGNEKVYDEKFNSALPVVITKLHYKICMLRKEGKYLEERVYLTFKKLIVIKCLLEHPTDDLKNKNMSDVVIGSLLEALGDENKEVHIGAIAALQNIGEPAINPLIAALGHENKEIRTGAMATLKNIGEPAVNPLIMSLRDENMEVRCNAALTLGIISEPSAVNPLIEALKDENEKVRAGATYSLCKIGEPAVKPLTALLNDKNQIVRQLAALCLKKIETGNLA